MEVPSRKPMATPHRFPSRNKPARRPEKASRPTWAMVRGSERLMIIPITTPTEAPSIPPPANAITMIR